MVSMTVTLKANLTACFLFVLAVVGIATVVGGLGWPAADDAVWLLAFMSPVIAWAAGAWVLSRLRWVSVVWLAISIALMAVGLMGIYVDVHTARQEKLTGEETMHLAAFLALLLQWFVALVLLVIVGAICLFTSAFRAARPR